MTPITSVSRMILPILALAGSSALLRLTDPLFGLIDVSLSAPFGATVQSAVGLGASLLTATAWLTGPLLFSSTTEVSQLYKQGDSSSVRIHCTKISIIALCLGVILMILLAGGVLLTSAPQQSKLYVAIRALALPFVALSMAVWGIFRATGRTWVAALVASGVVLSHALLASSLVDSMGSIGLAISGSTTQILGSLISLWIANRVSLFSPRRSLSPWRWNDVKSHVLLTLRSSTLGLATMFMAYSASHAPAVTSAGYQLTYQVWICFIMVLDGWRAAGQVMIAQQMDEPHDSRLSTILVMTAVVLAATAATIFFICGQLAINYLVSTIGVGQAVKSLWPFASAAIFLAGITFALDGIDYGHGNFATNLYRTAIGTLGWVGGGIACLYTGNAQHIWIGISLGFATRILLSIVTVVRRRLHF